MVIMECIMIITHFLHQNLKSIYPHLQLLKNIYLHPLHQHLKSTFPLLLLHLKSIYPLHHILLLQPQLLKLIYLLHL